MVKFCFILLIALISSSCDSYKVKNNNSSDAKDEIYLYAYSISENKRDSLLAKGDADINEVLSDFNYYYNEALDSLKKMNVITNTTNKRRVEIKNEVIVVPSNSIVGFVIYNQKKGAKYYDGVFSKVDILNLILNY